MSKTNAVAIILAAGEGKRMGFPKALLEQEKGKSFLQVLRSTFDKAGCGTLVVVGKDAAKIREHHPQVALLENAEWKQGQFSSVKVGLQAALAEGAELIAVHPVDMPMVRANTVKALLATLEKRSSEGVVPEFDGAAGHPLVLTREAAQRVLKMTDVPHLEAAQARLKIARMKTNDPAVMVNLNTPEVYERVLGMAPRLAPPKKKRGADV